MPLPNYRISIVKSLDAEEWSNDYMVICDDMDDASDFAEALVEFEQSFHFDTVQFAYVRVSTTLKGDRTFRHIPLNVAGIAQSAGQDFLPLFNTVRVDLGTSDSDPARKYYRTPIGEAQQSRGILAGNTIAGFEDLLGGSLQPLILQGKLVTSGGNLIVGSSLYHNVQERQLKRRRRKKAPAVSV